MSATRMFRKLLALVGSLGGASVTSGLSGVGPPPSLMIIQALATFIMAGLRSRTTWPPSPSA